MPVLTKQPSMGDVLKYEANPNYTREVVTLLQGMPYPVGAVLGQITASGKYKLATATGSDGAQTASAVLLYAVDATLQMLLALSWSVAPPSSRAQASPTTDPSMTAPRSPPKSPNLLPSASSPATASDARRGPLFPSPSSGAPHDPCPQSL